MELMNNLKALIEFQPQITKQEDGPEPSLRTIVMRYYLQCSSTPGAIQLTNRYMEELNKFADKNLTMG
jgi:hypothetical protein